MAAERGPYPLADAVRAIAPNHVFGLRVGSVEGEQADGLPEFENRVWFLDADGRLPALPAELVDAVGSQPDSCVFVDCITQSRALAVEGPGGRHRGPAAIIHHVASSLPSGVRVLFLAPYRVAVAQRFRVVREELDRLHGLDWLVYLPGTAVPGVHAAFNMLLVGGKTGDVDNRLLRLVDLRSCAPARWRKELREALKRGGGENGCSIVLRYTRPGGQPWLYEPYTKAHAASRDDLRLLGELYPLGELVESVEIGLHPRDNLELVDPGDRTEVPDGMMPVLTGRDVYSGGFSPVGRFWVNAAEVPARARLDPGDVLIRRVSVGRLVAATVPPGFTGTFGHTLLRLRWKRDIPEHSRELLLSWLTSERVISGFSTLGSAISISPSLLKDVEVPLPNQHIQDSLAKLADIERWYQARARVVQAARQSIFDAASYAEAIPLVLEAQRLEGERVTAAEDSQRYEYKVRNYFPHPIALRLERIAIEEHGRARVAQTLECAEHLMHFLAVLGLAQQRAAGASGRIPSKYLASVASPEFVCFDWGTSHNILREAASATAAADALSLPVPQLGGLRGTLLDESTPAAEAERVLRRHRNGESHLHRLPSSELIAHSESLAEHLARLTKSVDFISDIPLVLVRDYALNGMTGERVATLEYLRGASVVFERKDVMVAEELPRGVLGILAHDGTFHSLAPWLMFQTCELCKRPEVFVFNRYGKGRTTFVAMESGHPLETDIVIDVFARLP